MLAKCNNDSSKNKSNDDKKIGLLSDDQFEKLINNTNNLNDIAQLTFSSNFGQSKSLGQNITNWNWRKPREFKN
nr:hypothetical protein [Mycoplasmopsis bovis]